MKKMNNEIMKRQFAGRTYFCPWSDYSSNSFWTTYAHAIKCGYKHGYFDIPIAMIKAGIRLR